MTKICRVCNLKHEIVLINVPKNDKKREVWSEACQIQLKKTEFLCERHFKPSDFIGGVIKRNARLKPDATPFTKKNFSASVKEEPIELDKDPCPELHRPMLEPLIVKVEVDPLNFIHEEHFDEQRKIVEPGKPLERQHDILPIVKHLDFGCIIFALENDSFTINCKYCEAQYEISDVQNFVIHVKEVHAGVINAQKPKQINEGNKEDDILNMSNVSAASEKVGVKEESEENPKEEANENGFENSDVNEDADEDNKPKVKRQKLSKEKRTSNTKKVEDNMITFDTQPQDYVFTFLELLKSNAILWHRRQSIMKRFDETLSEVVAKFNKAHTKYQLTSESARMSLYRIKDLFQRITDTNHKRHIKRSAHKTKFPEFFEYCNAIDENSKKLVVNCTNCRAFFYTELDLQIHKAKSHKIGELPFKCSRCNYAFANAQVRDAHESRHKHAHDFVCDVCNRGFDSEQKLRAHAYTHSDDVKPVCEKCGEIFNNYNIYRRHKLRHEAPKEKCDMCGKLFYEKWNLTEHIKSHLNERSYNCDICNKSFNHHNDVTIHKRGVHNIKPTKRRAIWVSQSDLERISQHKNENKSDEESSDSENFYNDNFQHFMFLPQKEK